MIEVYEEWSDRDRRKSASRPVSAPDVSSMRRGINTLSQQLERKRSSSHSSTRMDKEEVNLDDPYPYDEPNHQYSSRTVSTATSKYNPPEVAKSILKVLPAPPTPDFQPPPTPEFQPPPTPDFQPPSTSPQVTQVRKRYTIYSTFSHPYSAPVPPSTPEFQPPPTPEFHPPSTPEFLPPPPTPESHHDMPPPSSKIFPHNIDSHSFPATEDVLSPTKRARFQ